MKIELVEANMTGLQHSYHNSFCIRVFNKIAEKRGCILNCSKSQYENLNIEELGIKTNYLKVLKPGKHRIIKFFLEYFQTMKIIKKSNADLIVFLSSFPNVQYFYILNAKKFKNKKIILMTHGELEGLVLPGKKWKFWSYPFWITRCFNHELPSNIYRIVLGKSIADNLKKFCDGKNIFFIDQPRGDFQSTNDNAPAVKNNIFAFVGNCLYKKGGSTFLKSMEIISVDSKSVFEIIGAYDLSEKGISNRLKLLGKPHQMISRELFDESMKRITYACFPYPSDTYKFTASGAVLDAIIYLKPIIYIKNDYFDGIFEDAGDIGYRCKDEKEFIETIRSLDNNPDKSRYLIQVDNLKKLQNKFSVENVENQLKSIVSKIMEPSK